MAWHQTDDKPLSKAIVVYIIIHYYTNVHESISLNEAAYMEAVGRDRVTPIQPGVTGAEWAHMCCCDGKCDEIVLYELAFYPVCIMLIVIAWWLQPSCLLFTDHLLTRLTLIPAWISNHKPSNVWDEITYPFLNFNGATVEV